MVTSQGQAMFQDVLKTVVHLAVSPTGMLIIMPKLEKQQGVCRTCLQCLLISLVKMARVVAYL